MFRKKKTLDLKSVHGRESRKFKKIRNEYHEACDRRRLLESRIDYYIHKYGEAEKEEDLVRLRNEQRTLDAKIHYLEEDLSEGVIRVNLITELIEEEKEERHMLDKENIMGIIADHDKKIREIKEAIATVNNEIAVKAMKNQLSFLEDNVFRYRLQAKAWGLI